MRSLFLLSLCSIFCFFPGSGKAGDSSLPETAASEVKAATPSGETYRAYVLHLSQIAGRKDFAKIVDALRRQLDLVERAPLSPRVLNFFHTVPIVADELACLEKELPAAACYGPAAPERAQHGPHEFTVWDSKKSEWTNSDPVVLASEARGGVVMFRPHLNAQSPTMLHELLHAYHARMMPEGYRNQGILFYYNAAKGKKLYAADEYLMTNEKEFFAVTATVFLCGKDSKEPFTRSNLKEKQPDYFKYLIWLFEVDPDRAASATPIASAY
jgi:hypothetical protein